MGSKQPVKAKKQKNPVSQKNELILTNKKILPLIVGGLGKRVK